MHCYNNNSVVIINSVKKGVTQEHDSVGITDGLSSQLLRKLCVISVRTMTLYNIILSHDNDNVIVIVAQCHVPTLQYPNSMHAVYTRRI